MKRCIKLKDYFSHILREVIKADTDFKLQQAFFLQNTKEYKGPVAASELKQLERKYMKDIAATSLNIENIELTLYLKKHHPSWLMGLWLRITGRKDHDLYCIGSAKDYEVPVKFSITRTNAFSPLQGQTEPKEYEESLVEV